MVEFIHFHLLWSNVYAIFFWLRISSAGPLGSIKVSEPKPIGGSYEGPVQSCWGNRAIAKMKIDPQ